MKIFSMIPQPQSNRRPHRREWGANVTNRSEWAEIEQKYPLISVFIGNQGVYSVSLRLNWQKKRQPCGCLLWWAKRDLNLSYVNRFAQSSDHKADLPYPKNRPFIKFAYQNPISIIAEKPGLVYHQAGLTNIVKALQKASFSFLNNL